MDPNLIHLDWERTFEALMIVILLAFIVERALAVVFENRLYIEYMDRSGLKELIAVAVSIGICAEWKFDAISMILLTAETTVLGYAATGAVIAGGSKASIKLFHDVFNIRSSAYEMRREIQADKAARDAQNSLDLARSATTATAAARAAKAAQASADTAKTVADISGTLIAKQAADRAAEAALNAQNVANAHLNNV